MPTVKNLVNGSAAPTYTPAAGPTTAVAPAPLPAAGNALAVPLPSFLAALPQVTQDTAENLPGGASGNYVAVYESNSRAALELKAAGVQLGSHYLCADGKYHPAPTLGFWLVSAVAFRSKIDPNGIIVKASTDMFPTAKDDLDNHYVCLILVDLGDRIVPAKFEPRGTKERAGAEAIKAVAFAHKPEWASQSDAHRITAAFAVPWGRAYIKATTTPRTSKSTGNQYFLASATVQPSTVDQMKRLNEALASPALQGEMAATVDSFKARVELLTKVAGV